MNNGRLRKIERYYDPEADLIPGGPRVTWAEYLLADFCDDLLDEIDSLKKRVDELETAVRPKETESNENPNL